VHLTSTHERTESVGRGLVERYEASQDRTLRSIESGWNTRLPGLEAFVAARVPEPKPRFSADFVAYDADGSVARVIEMKCSGLKMNSVGLKERQVNAARALGGDYWLYAAFDCRTEEPFLVVVRDPGRLPWKSITGEPEVPWAKKGSVGSEQTLHCMPSDIIAAGQRVHVSPAGPSETARR